MATQTVQRVTGTLTVNQAPRVLLAADATVGPGVQVAQGNVTVDPRDGLVYGNDAVVVTVALAGAPSAILTGTVVSESIVLAPRALSFAVVGLLDRARHEIGVPEIPGRETLDAQGNPLPVATWTSIDDGALVRALLDLSGVPYSADQIATAGVTLGVVAPFALGRSDHPFDKIAAIDEALGMRTFELGDGTVRRLPWSGLPPAGGIALTEGVNLQECTRTLALDGMFNRITVTGAPTVDGAPHTTLDAPSRTNPATGRPYIATPPTFRAATYSSPVLETYDLVTAYGRRFLAAHNRLQETVQARPLPPNPALVPGTGAIVVSPKEGLDASSAYRIDTLHTQIGPQGLRTDLTLAGGYVAEGIDTNLLPVPSFTIRVLREHIAGQGDVWVVMADGSASSDPEGTFTQADTTDSHGNLVPGFVFNGIFRYQWASTLGVAPRVVADGKRALWTVDSDPTGRTITLTVYDSQLASSSLTKAISPTAANAILLRDLWLAVESELLYTNDGERTWGHVAVAAVFVPEQAAETFTLAIDTSGLVYKVLTDLSFTLLAGAPTNATCAAIRYKYPETTVAGDRCWLGTANGEVWFSPDKAVTWLRKGALPGAPAITDLSESPFVDGDVYATARNALFHSFDAGVTWGALVEHPNTALLATKLAAGFTDLFFALHGAPPATDPGTETSRIRERRDRVKGDWVRSATGGAGLAAGTYRVAISYRGASGETAIGPTRAVTVPLNSVIAIPPVTPLPQGATGVYYYCALVAGGTALGRAGVGTGDTSFLVLAAPDASTPPAPINTAVPTIPNPTVNPLSVAVAPPASAVDFPAQPAAITMGVYHESLAAVGLTPDGGAHSWYADASGSFTFARGVYPSDQFGAPADIYRDGFIEDVVYVLGHDAFGKTTTNFAEDCFRVLPLVAPQVGRKLGYGALRAIAPATGGDLIVSAHRIDGENPSQPGTLANAIVMLAGTVWSKLSDHPVPIGDHHTILDFPGFVNFGAAPEYSVGASHAFVRPLIKGADDTLYTFCFALASNLIVGCNPSYGNLHRSADGGRTWAPVGGVTGVTSLTVAVDGSLWAVANDGEQIVRSVDAGATWTTMAGRPHTLDAAAADRTGIWPFDGKWEALDASATTASTLAATFHDGLMVTHDGFVTAHFVPIHDFANGAGSIGVARTPDDAATLLDRETAAAGGGHTTYRAADAATSGTPVAGLAASIPSDAVQGVATYRRHGGRVYLHGQTQGTASGGIGAATYASDDGGLTWSAALAAGDAGSPNAASADSAVAPTTGDGYLALLNGVPSGAEHYGEWVGYVKYSGGAWADATGGHVATLGGLYRSHPLGMVLGPGTTDSGTPPPLGTPPPAPPAPPGTIPPPGTTPAPGLSGMAMPVGDLPGWRQILADDFTQTVPLGLVGDGGIANWSYAYNAPDTSGRDGTDSRWDSAATISIHDGVLDYYLHTAGGTALSGAVGRSVSHLYGRYDVMLRADPIAGYKTAFLLWPDSEVWPRDGEIDFPEGDLNATAGGSTHYQGGTSGGDQDVWTGTSGATYDGWHVYTIEWTPSAVVYFIDHVEVHRTTSGIPNTPMHWVLQSEAWIGEGQPPSGSAGHVLIDWAVEYEYAP